jgi:serine/threonine-protein kinase
VTGTTRIVGRYAISTEIAAGGMATVHLGRLLGPAGFARVVAIKRLHAHLAGDPDLVAMLLDEARVAARIRHPNVVPTLDVVATGGELFLVMEYVEGESLSRLLRAAVAARRGPPPPRVVAAVVCGALHGLHAAHEARGENGEPLHVVHRDVSPQNLLVGADGVARVLDFGIAKAVGRSQATRAGVMKGKLGYMAPEQLRFEPVSARTDVYAAAVVLWEALTCARLFAGEDEQVVRDILAGDAPPPSTLAPGLPEGLDAIVARGMAIDPAARFASAREMALAVERVVGLASPAEVAAWVAEGAADALHRRATLVAELEATRDDDDDDVRTVAVRKQPAPAAAPPAAPKTAPAASQAPAPLRAPTPRPLSAASPMPAATPLRAPAPLSAAAPIEARTPLPAAATPSPRRAPTSLVAMVAATVVVSLAAALLALAAPRGHAHGGADAGDARAPSTTTADAVDTSIAIDRLAASSSAIAPAASSATAPEPTTTGAARSTGVTTARPRTDRAPSRTARCAVPYDVDDAGTKRYRPECFR